VLDALLSPRPYKPGWSLDDAMAYLREQSGRHFDPRCVEALERSRTRLEDICARYSATTPRPGVE